MSKDNNPVGLYGKIIRCEEVERAGIKGLLVWDAMVFNEITFEESITHKKTSLYLCWSDTEAKEVFDKLVAEYKKDKNDEAIIIGKKEDNNKNKLLGRAKEFLSGNMNRKADKDEYNILLNDLEKYLLDVPQGDPLYEVYNKLADLK